MFITGLMIGILIGSITTLMIHCCLILGKSKEEHMYKNS